MQATAAIKNWFAEIAAGWNRFWFEPSDPATLGLIRICAGAMLFYTHLVWSLDLTNFVGPTGWLPRAAVETVQRGTYSWSYLWWIEGSPVLLWTAHVAALIVFAMLTLGLFTRVSAVLALVATLSYVERLPGALFGLDQINTMLALYLVVGPAGDAFSLDRLLKQRRSGGPLPVRFSWTANLAVRLIQIHMCIIYLFAGLSKLTGQAWWDGTALWMAFGNMEYQSMDMTWMADHPYLINVMSQVTVAWEIFYCALIWARLTRPVMLALAIPLHMGIAICLGMITFGLAMLIGNMAFLSPSFVRSIVAWLPRKRQGRAGEARLAGGPALATKPAGRTAARSSATKR
jgi:hypothetical protein